MIIVRYDFKIISFKYNGGRFQSPSNWSQTFMVSFSRSLLHCFRFNDVGVHNSLLVYGNNSG